MRTKCPVYLVFKNLAGNGAVNIRTEEVVSANNSG